jgi:hypothetical protein
MTPEDLPNRENNELRLRAVERVAENIRTSVFRCGNDIRRMLQEMEGYNIELEMQIEKLRNAEAGPDTCRNSRD